MAHSAAKPCPHKARLLLQFMLGMIPLEFRPTANCSTRDKQSPRASTRAKVGYESTPLIKNSEPKFRKGWILLKNSENERRQKTRLWLCRADIATRCHRQFATVAAHRKVSFSAEPLAHST